MTDPLDPHPGVAILARKKATFSADQPSSDRSKLVRSVTKLVKRQRARPNDQTIRLNFRDRNPSRLSKQSNAEISRTKAFCFDSPNTNRIFASSPMQEPAWKDLPCFVIQTFPSLQSL